MRRFCEQAGYGQILPLLAVVSILSGSICNGQESFPNELNSPQDEPLVVLLQNSQKVPVRPASGSVLESTDPLVKLVYETREVQRQRLLSTTDHTPWQMMHGLLGLRQDFLISHNGDVVNGLDWIKTGPMFKNEPWFEKTSHGGRAHPYNQPYWFEGHISQSLAILSMCNVPLDTEFGTPQGAITMRDMLKNAQMTANEKEEVTWTLWALSTYLPSDAEWINAKGEKWSIERLVRIEVGKKVGGPTSPCGGTHGLFALARARNVYLRTGKPLRGVWQEAEYKIQKYINTAKMLQNANGTLSSNFFRGREYKQDFDKRMASSGHVLEFLMMALPQERLKEKWVRDAIAATANDLMANRKAYVSCSPLYHATDALSIYLERVLPSHQPAIAQQPENTKAISTTKDLPPVKDVPAIDGNSETKTMGSSVPTVTGESNSKSATGMPPGGPESSTPDTPAAAGGPTPAKTPEVSPMPSTPVTKPEEPGVTTDKGALPITEPGTEIKDPSTPSPQGTPSGNPLIQIPLPDPTEGIAEPQPALASTPTSTSETANPQLVDAAGIPAAPSTDLHSIAPVRAAEPPVTAETAKTESVSTPMPVPLPELTTTSVIVEPSVSAPLSRQGLKDFARAKTVVKPLVLFGVVQKLPVFSAEQVVDAAGPAGAMAPMFEATPLQSTESVGNTPAIPDIESSPQSESSTGSELPVKSHNKDSTPDEKRYGEWKSTPLGRRKPILVDAPQGV